MGHVLRSLLGKTLGEKVQATACKELVRTVEKIMAGVDAHPENAKDAANQETLHAQHQLVVALQELGEDEK